jgi:hypothetical protein
MSDLTEVALVVALFIAASFLYFSMNRWVQERYDAVETGLAGGAPMSTGFRRLQLTTQVMPSIATVVIIMGFLGVGWVFIGEATDSEGAKLLAYLAAFVASLTAFGWLVVGPFVYAHLVSRTRQAEAD